MNMRKEIERLIYWYVLAVIVASAVGFILSSYIRTTNDTSSITVWSYTSINMLINNLHHIVVAIWLYVISKYLNQKYILWSLFGLIAHLFAVVIFIGLYIYEKNILDSRICENIEKH